MFSEAGLPHGLLRLPPHSSRQLSPAAAQYHLLSVLLPCGTPVTMSMPQCLPLGPSPALFPAWDGPILLGLPSFVSFSYQELFSQRASLSFPGSPAELSLAWKGLFTMGHIQSKCTQTLSLPNLSLPSPISRPRQKCTQERLGAWSHLILSQPHNASIFTASFYTLTLN